MPGSSPASRMSQNVHNLKGANKMKNAKVSRTARMFQLVLAGYSNEAAVQVIKKEYGKNVPTNTASIGWCRTQLKAKTTYAKTHNPKNQKVVSDREAKIQAIPQKAETK